MHRVGFHNPFLAAFGGGDKYLFTMLAELATTQPAELVVYCPDDPRVGRWDQLGIAIDPDRVEWVRASADDVTRESASLDLLVVLSNDVPVLSHSRRAVAMIQFPVRPRESIPERARAAVLDAVGRRRAPAALASYDSFICNSRFTRHWIRRRLGVEATVIAPPIDPPSVPIPAEKDRRILSVGRFVPDVHDKRREVLIEAFRALRQQCPGAQAWGLDLVGTANATGPSQELLRRLRADAEGLPVRFHVDASYQELAQLYARSDLFWHATGFGVDPQRHPERLEHFGMVTAEAMMHGTVPLVVPLGGQAEIVDDGQNGRHWRSIPELVERTSELIEDRPLAERLRTSARREAGRFDTGRFRREVRARIFDPYLPRDD